MNNSVFMVFESFPHSDAILMIHPNKSVSFEALVSANINGNASAAWSFAGLIKRGFLLDSTELIDVNSINISADDIFKTCYVDIHANKQMGALVIQAGNPIEMNINWSARIYYKEIA